MIIFVNNDFTYYYNYRTNYVQFIIDNITSDHDKNKKKTNKKNLNLKLKFKEQQI